MFSLDEYFIFLCQTIKNNKNHTLESVTVVFLSTNRVQISTNLSTVVRYCWTYLFFKYFEFKIILHLHRIISVTLITYIIIINIINNAIPICIN